MRIVTSLTDQIEGEIKLERENGTKFTITFQRPRLLMKIINVL